mmetsp:Transcript_7706/g.16518  ORF Transcript_7706/g.16518 Transcript_7706/m.16518 type:complete len:540 (+) Transcript_7706:237-1856(+)
MTTDTTDAIRLDDGGTMPRALWNDFLVSTKETYQRDTTLFLAFLRGSHDNLHKSRLTTNAAAAPTPNRTNNDGGKNNNNTSRLPSSSSSSYSYQSVCVQTTRKDLMRDYATTVRKHREEWEKLASAVEAKRKTFIDRTNNYNGDDDATEREAMRGLVEEIVSEADELTSTIRTALRVNPSIQKHLSRRNPSSSPDHAFIAMDYSTRHPSRYFEGGPTVHLLTVVGCISCQTKIEAMGMSLWPREFLEGVVTDLEDILLAFYETLCSEREDGRIVLEHDMDGSPLIPRELEINVLGKAGRSLEKIGEHQLSTRFYRACCTALRLRSSRKDAKYGKVSVLHGRNAMERVVALLVHTKAESGCERPFFSTKRLVAIEKELLIGSESPRNLFCHGCNRKHGFVFLRKCSGCRRTWFCSQECQHSTWKTHRHDCGSKWRDEPIVELYKRDVWESMEDEYHRTRGMPIIRCLGTCVYAFCKDPTTGEWFDGLTDRPVFFESIETTTDEGNGDGCVNSTTTSESGCLSETSASTLPLARTVSILTE